LGIDHHAATAAGVAGGALTLERVARGPLGRPFAVGRALCALAAGRGSCAVAARSLRLRGSRRTLLDGTLLIRTLLVRTLLV
jgi:hypothetical protein